MGYRNFIPEVWSEAIDRELERALVFAEGCNRQYEGEVKKMGDAVRILGVGRPTIITTEDREIALADPEEVDDTSLLLPVRQISYFHYKIDDIDKRQAVGGVLEALNAEATAGLADAMDRHIAAQAASRDAVLLSDSPASLTADNILGQIDAALEKLYESDVKPNGRIMMEVPPWFYMRLKTAYTALDTNNSKILENGRVGRYGNVEIKMSNNVATDSAGNSLVMVHTDKAIAFVKPVTHTEAYRPEKGFCDAVKGYVLYQARIVRPKELVVLSCKAGA